MVKAMSPKRKASDSLLISHRKKTTPLKVRFQQLFIEKTDGKLNWLEIPDSDDDASGSESGSRQTEEVSQDTAGPSGHSPNNSTVTKGPAIESKSTSTIKSKSIHTTILSSPTSNSHPGTGKRKKFSSVISPSQPRITSFFTARTKLNTTGVQSVGKSGTNRVTTGKLGISLLARPCEESSTGIDGDTRNLNLPNQAALLNVNVSEEKPPVSTHLFSVDNSVFFSSLSGRSEPGNVHPAEENVSDVLPKLEGPLRSQESKLASPAQELSLPVEVSQSNVSMKTPSRFLAGPSFSNRITALKPVVRSEALLRIERNWNELAEAAGAAKIIIVNDIDNTAPVDEDFVYLENTRRYDEQNHLPSQYQLLKSLPKIKCPSCKKNRTCSSHCECDEMMVFHDDEFVNIRPYDEDGLFRFNVPPGGIVNECNIGCPCDKSVCVNSVAQHPRSIPIEVFKTQNRGWGVRSSVFVKKGTVLGIYTGDLIHRQIAEDLEGDQTTYVFDLDTDEDCDTDISENAYSVNAMYSGNWTRFINHSCAPNLKIYSASWEIRAEMGMQNLVFVAACNIKPGIEFTFDYDPEQSGADEVASNNNHVKKEKDRDKSRGHIPRGAILCLCMTDNCRGWVRAFSSKH